MQFFQDAVDSLQVLRVDVVKLEPWVPLGRLWGDQTPHMYGLNWMVVVPNRWPWLAVLAGVVIALVVHCQASSAPTFWLGMPVWVLLFMALQAALTVVAAWMARR